MFVESGPDQEIRRGVNYPNRKHKHAENGDNFMG